MPMGLLQVLLKVGELCSLKMKNDLMVVSAAMAWPLLQVPCEATTKQSQAEERMKKADEEVRLERDLRVTQANGKDILGRQLEQTSEHLQDLA